VPVGIRADDKVPSIHWSRVECALCKQQVWVPGVRPEQGVCSVHVDNENRHGRYLESIITT